MKAYPLKSGTQVVKIIKENLEKFPRVHGDEIEAANAEFYQKIDRNVLDELEIIMDKKIPTWGSKDKYKENTFFGGIRESGKYVPVGLRLEGDPENFNGGGNKNFKTKNNEGERHYHQPHIIIKIEPNYIYNKFKWSHGNINHIKDWIEVYKETPFIRVAGKGGQPNPVCFAALNAANKVIGKNPKVLEDILNCIIYSQFKPIEDQNLRNALIKFLDQINKRDFTDDKDSLWRKRLSPDWGKIRGIILQEFMQVLIRLYEEKELIKVVPVGLAIQYEEKEIEINPLTNGLSLKESSRYFGEEIYERDAAAKLNIKRFMQNWVEKINKNRRDRNNNEMA